ncbi:MAG TPA: amidohydrolase family protein [Anaerolineae bacterium]|nr:amidohydrolase family protein [Anaerolineae bacterium]
MPTLAVVNIGCLISGDLETGLIEADTLLIENGHFSQIGHRSEIDLSRAEQMLDAQGCTVAPGLIDSHVHIVFGDWTPRQNTLGWIESYMHGGITGMMSASEVHLPGVPKDPVGVKALAIAAQRAYATYRPGGVKVYAGSVIFQPGLTEADFAEMASAGVWLGKVGFGDFAKPTEAEPLVRLAQKHGFKVMCHTGGASIPGSAPVTAEDLLVLQPDISGHTNGGTTALPDEGLELLVRQADFALQISQAGNIRSAVKLVNLAREHEQLHRILISSDTPSGTGVMPMGTLKSVVEMSTLTGLPAEQAWALACGNNADVLETNTGRIEVGRAADLLVMDAPLGCVKDTALAAIENGDLPGISCVIIDGEIRAMKSRNTPAATRMARLGHS